jgi:hypothetical protein
MQRESAGLRQYHLVKRSGGPTPALFIPAVADREHANGGDLSSHR